MSPEGCVWGGSLTAPPPPPPPPATLTHKALSLSDWGFMQSVAGYRQIWRSVLEFLEDWGGLGWLVATGQGLKLAHKQVPCRCWTRLLRWFLLVSGLHASAIHGTVSICTIEGAWCALLPICSAQCMYPHVHQCRPHLAMLV